MLKVFNVVLSLIQLLLLLGMAFVMISREQYASISESLYPHSPLLMDSWLLDRLMTPYGLVIPLALLMIVVMVWRKQVAPAKKCMLQLGLCALTGAGLGVLMYLLSPTSHGFV